MSMMIRKHSVGGLTYLDVLPAKSKVSLWQRFADLAKKSIRHAKVALPHPH